MDPSGLQGRELVFTPNHHGEQVLIGAALASNEYARAAVQRHPPERFLVDEHRRIWRAVAEACRRQLDLDPATLNRLSSEHLDIQYLADLMGARPQVPDQKTIEFHEEQLCWDHQRVTALTGPISTLIEAIQKGEPPERVRALAKACGESFEGDAGRLHPAPPGVVVEELVAELRGRREGRAVYPFGLDGLDFVDPNPNMPVEGWQRRLIPAASPGTVTVVTGLSGSGKSTLTARLVLGLARQRRRILYGAWEMNRPITMELLAVMSLAEKEPDGGWNRERLKVGDFDDARLEKIRATADAIARRVSFMPNVFRKRHGQRRSNDHNLDTIAAFIADSGCDVFVADLWKRCLVRIDPDEEEDALCQQQTIAEELKVHCILVQQQRLKDIEQRADKRPTREGIKGSGTWTEVADNMLAVHRPAMFKSMPDDKMEVGILKQRYGRAPQAVEFDWNPDHGSIAGGRSITWDLVAPLEGSSNELDSHLRTPTKGKRGRE